MGMQRLSSQMGKTKAHINASRLLEWLKNINEDDQEPLKQSDLLQKGPNPIRNKDKRDSAVKILSEQGWIQVKNWKSNKVILKHPLIRN